MSRARPTVHSRQHRFFMLLLTGFMLAAVFSQVGCAAQKTKGTLGDGINTSRGNGDQQQLNDLVADGDVNDPTAAVLHDLAGRLLLYKATNRKMPVELVDLYGGPQSGSSKWAKPMLDPASSQPFFYTPNSTRQAGLPGRIILYQPQSQGGAGRWALLFNDESKEGKVVTYVQRVPESMIPVVKSNTTRIRR